MGNVAGPILLRPLTTRAITDADRHAGPTLWVPAPTYNYRTEPSAEEIG